MYTVPTLPVETCWIQFSQTWLKLDLCWKIWQVMNKNNYCSHKTLIDEISTMKPCFSYIHQTYADEIRHWEVDCISSGNK